MYLESVIYGVGHEQLGEGGNTNDFKTSGFSHWIDDIAIP
jgi:hypothetical protein